jgi:hypothetical protein
MLHIKRIALATTALSLLGVQGSGAADDFRLTIGSPIAVVAPVTSANPGASPIKKNGAVFVVRTDGCDRSKAVIAGTAEGVVNGGRRSVPLVLSPAPMPGVYTINRTWPEDGVWVANLVGNCQTLKAGAIVPIAVGPNGFVRESSKFFPRPATSAEIDAALNAHAANTATR